ncbi:MAG: hypothetical protein ACTHNT_13985 [Actinomycetales bacterium]
MGDSSRDTSSEIPKDAGAQPTQRRHNDVDVEPGVDERLEPGVDAGDIAARSRLLPEEQQAGSDDPQVQAAAVLADSEERIADPDPDASEQTALRGTHAADH